MDDITMEEPSASQSQAQESQEGEGSKRAKLDGEQRKQLAEAERRHGPVDGQGHEAATLPPALRLVADPVRGHRGRRPQHHHAGRRLERRLGGLEIVLPALEPPYLPLYHLGYDSTPSVSNYFQPKTPKTPS